MPDDQIATHGARWRELLREANFINGQWVQADSGEKINVIDPATGNLIGLVPNCGREETRRAIEAASACFAEFAALTAEERAGMLFGMADIMEAEINDLAVLLTREQGKPLAEARGEIGMSVKYLRWFAEEARRAYGAIVPSPWAGREIHVVLEPVGVVGAITPWNFPSSMLARKIAPAIAAGCPVVAKPALQTPFSALVWADIAYRAGVPAGAVNIVTGHAEEIGAELTGHPKVLKITFTGSTAVGINLMRAAADGVKRVSMELGGNAPVIVFDDADLDTAIACVMASKFRNSGQTCVCSNRIFVQSGIHDQFVERLVAAVEQLVMGDGCSPDVTQGPLIDERAVAKVSLMVSDAIAKGGIVRTGGSVAALGPRYFEPTVVTGATSEMALSGDEIFGPIAPIFRFETEDEIYTRANETEHGLAAYVCTKDLGRAHRASRALKYGLVGVNEGGITTEVAPFGGMKQSGIGSEGGQFGLREYLDVKYICFGGLQNKG